MRLIVLSINSRLGKGRFDSRKKKAAGFFYSSDTYLVFITLIKGAKNILTIALR